MPTKLKVVLVLLVISAAFNLFTGALLSGGIGVLLIVGLVKGSDGTRQILRGLAFVAMAVAIVGILNMIGSMRWTGVSGVAVAIGGAIALSPSAFMAWCLGQPDVQHWMYRQGLPDAVRDL